MWIFLRRRAIQWAVLSVAVPLTVRLAATAADRLERRGGSSPVTKGLRQVAHAGDLLRPRGRRGRAPARRGRGSGPESA